MKRYPAFSDSETVDSLERDLKSSREMAREFEVAFGGKVVDVKLEAAFRGKHLLAHCL